MRDRKAANRAALLAGAALLVAITAAGLWLVRWSGESADAPAPRGMVVLKSRTPAAVSPPLPAPTQAADLPALPSQVIAHVREAYPLLTEVDFRCDAEGCALTATIPPPTGDADVQQRQELLVGGLAKRVAADGYRMPGPVRMEEVDDNRFHIRAAVVGARERAM